MTRADRLEVALNGRVASAAEIGSARASPLNQPEIPTRRRWMANQDGHNLNFPVQPPILGVSAMDARVTRGLAG
jgi:hypothetical protein